MIKFPNCKINLGLHIVEKRSDGFHNIETVFYPVSLSDILEIVPSDQIQFESTGICIPGNADDNLVMKAYRLISEDYDIPEIKVHLHKIIPAGAGLGGGSSDASFMIKLLNEQFDLKMSEEKMMAFARQLGSDCSFFIKNKPVFAHQKGDTFEEIELNLSGYQIMIIKPEVHISSADAYSGVLPKKPEMALTDIIKLPVEEWKSILINDFEKTVFSKFPQIQSLKDQLYAAGAVYASMSGSGASVFGLFKNEIPEMNFNNCFAWKGSL
ncbi:MAG: 4-(cytidine 5'-diphospho)-2-C-methyl-D-erythritol kinase [Bacteroidales bacterium]|nr:4-(cytidine 5'-diphospho)-2-C-methyl-D-erythritol kinase [Bacteroidales bacterium]